ncbi:MAG: microcyclamide/patellamide family RiPP [Leptolyngbya sp. SIO1D8]|nr:microcyclamide/patellamide family RiPP [Leptolyngbya sp. SIO1D8]
MGKKNLMPNQSSPVSRMTAGQLPPELAELAEEALCSHDGGGVTPSSDYYLNNPFINTPFAPQCFCSYDGDDAE